MPRKRTYASRIPLSENMRRRLVNPADFNNPIGVETPPQRALSPISESPEDVEDSASPGCSNANDASGSMEPSPSSSNASGSNASNEVPKMPPRRFTLSRRSVTEATNTRRLIEQHINPADLNNPESGEAPPHSARRSLSECLKELQDSMSPMSSNTSIASTSSREPSRASKSTTSTGTVKRKRVKTRHYLVRPARRSNFPPEKFLSPITESADEELEHSPMRSNMPINSSSMINEPMERNARPASRTRLPSQGPLSPIKEFPEEEEDSISPMGSNMPIGSSSMNNETVERNVRPESRAREPAEGLLSPIMEGPEELEDSVSPDMSIDSSPMDNAPIRPEIPTYYAPQRPLSPIVEDPDAEELEDKDSKDSM